MSNNSPIGVFDSGLGGLTVLKELINKMPHEDFIYLGDTARIPYGAKSHNTVLKYAQQNVNFLKGQGVKSVVIACNTASTVADEIQSDIDIFCVILPSAQAAATATKNNKVGVIATRATVSKRSYVTEIKKLNPGVQVFQQACPLLVPLVEEGWDHDPITNLIVYRYLSPLLASEIDSLILGCTHYPILLGAIRKVTGPHVHIMSSGEFVAKRVRESLKEKSQLTASPKPGKIRLLTTDQSDIYNNLASRILNQVADQNIEFVDI